MVQTPEKVRDEPCQVEILAKGNSQLKDPETEARRGRGCQWSTEIYIWLFHKLVKNCIPQRTIKRLHCFRYSAFSYTCNMWHYYDSETRMFFAFPPTLRVLLVCSELSPRGSASMFSTTATKARGQVQHLDILQVTDAYIRIQETVGTALPLSPTP